MAAKVKVKLNRRGVVALLRSPALQGDLDRRGRNIAAAAGEGFEARTSDTPQRARTVVLTTTHQARRAEATDRALTRSVDAGRR